MKKIITIFVGVMIIMTNIACSMPTETTTDESTVVPTTETTPTDEGTPNGENPNEPNPPTEGDDEGTENGGTNGGTETTPTNTITNNTDTSNTTYWCTISNVSSTQWNEIINSSFVVTFDDMTVSEHDKVLWDNPNYNDAKCINFTYENEVVNGSTYSHINIGYKENTNTITIKEININFSAEISKNGNIASNGTRITNCTLSSITTTNGTTTLVLSALN